MPFFKLATALSDGCTVVDTVLKRSRLGTRIHRRVPQPSARATQKCLLRQSRSQRTATVRIIYLVSSSLLLHSIVIASTFIVHIIGGPGGALQ